ncbi:hypothetical protein [Sandaracinus amylolyticus]|uniref:hypothetical protein n=1 Tax=Sandaracinus amylolyticus TaxID=927083 RepID=UPI001F38539B|nr:hypothetical protein [Sandaracinus amylolyticus]UJR83037.1 Hypothetical protein I5071_51030 [Sandaracinus amylolyticus]
MRDRLAARGVWLVLALLAHAPIAGAQALNYSGFPVGSHALGLGGAFTGVADDASAVYHNPGALAFGDSGAVATSLSLNVSDRLTVRDGYASIGGAEDLRLDGDAPLPVFLGGVVHFGDDEAPRHGLAIATLNPHQETRAFSFHDADGASATSLRVEHRDGTRWFGIGYGLRPDRAWGLGVSLYAARRSMTHREEEVATVIGPRELLAARQTTTSLEAWHLVAMLGFHWQIDGRWRWGVTLRLPGIALSETASVVDHASMVVGGAPAATFERRDDLAGDSPIPWSIRSGLALALDPEILVALDLGVVGAAGRVRPFPSSESAPRPGVWIAREYDADAVFQAALGGEMTIAGIVPVAFGVFTNLSASPPLSRETVDSYRPDRIDAFGLSGSVGYRGDDYRIQVGVMAMLGWGMGLRPLGAIGAAEMQYAPTTVEWQTVYLFVTGGAGAIGRFARDVYREFLEACGVDPGGIVATPDELPEHCPPESDGEINSVLR